MIKKYTNCAFRDKKHLLNCFLKLNSSYDGAQEASVHHYTKSFRGFSAMLTPDQARKLAGLLHFILAFIFFSNLIRISVVLRSTSGSGGAGARNFTRRGN